MIKRLRVRNYLSLRDIDLELSRRNVLIGPNMAGKSNLVDCLRFLTTMVTSGVNKAFLDRGGFHEVVWKGGSESRITFELTVEVPVREKEFKKIYDYEISIVGGATGLIAVERELLTVRTQNTVATLIDLINGRGKINKEDGTQAFAPSEEPGRSALEFKVPGWEGTMVSQYVSAWRFYRLIPTLMKQSNAAMSQNFLNEGGDNFSSWLMTFQTSHPPEFRRIKQVATDVLPDLKEILTPPTQFATTYVTTHEKHLKGPINLWRMSDGELTFLALLSLIYAPEELSAPLYSPYLVDKLSLDELIVIEKANGASQFSRPASKTNLRELLEREEVGLGDLWYSGALGGV
ncbi:MAG: AAA family ATPase [candidate division NC10 bacterium]|nr:AAA family ATPase [candidate division NC10 bacterium]